MSLQHNEREMFTQLLKFPTEYPPSIGGVIENSMKKNVNRYYAAIFLHLGYVVAPTCFLPFYNDDWKVENALKTGVRSIILSIQKNKPSPCFASYPALYDRLNFPWKLWALKWLEKILLLVKRLKSLQVAALHCPTLFYESIALKFLWNASLCMHCLYILLLSISLQYISCIRFCT